MSCALAGLAAALCGAAVTAATQQPVSQHPVSQHPVATLAETIDVRVVNVEAVVTDARGERIAGLAVSDFRLLVHGAEVAIAFFNEIHQPALRSPPGTTEAGQPVARGVSYLVFIDEDFTRPSDRRKVLRGLRRQLSELRSEDRVSTVAWNGHRLDLLGAWTVPGPELDGVLEEALDRKSSDQQTPGRAGHSRPRQPATLELERVSADLPAARAQRDPGRGTAVGGPAAAAGARAGREHEDLRLLARAGAKSQHRHPQARSAAGIHAHSTMR